MGVIDQVGRTASGNDDAILVGSTIISEELSRNEEEAAFFYARITSAAESLRCALSQGSILAFGWPPSAVTWPHPQGPRIQIPSRVFAAPITLCEEGILPYHYSTDRWMSVAGAPRTFSHVLLQKSDVLRIWPLEQPELAAALPASDSGNPSDEVVWGWMLAMGKAEKKRLGAPMGRDWAIKECRRVTGAKHRQAETAHARLPPDLRRSRGRTPKAK